ncbi:hypothetical protein CNBE2000 [Cryptococcus deneoformans B-3501A]|uniref:hypothetical protein n=1 Tax=Cryptococcus deneoformans (strain B-3501A) TaxID=283643 RepID=UPI000042C6FB|nr:hypothetical protein CNBE2000 [Cryptococcus neoformans var. neoformans B-3501A]EAL20839.1 hypothetical protein CNBE2000 [Cryptococcus neoformans var. neoformans B-3501A]
MDPWSVSIDTLFLVLTLLLIPSISRTPQLNITPPGDLLISPPASPLSPITPASASSSHLSVPGVGMPFVVPSIILTPDAPETYSRSRRSSIGSLTKRFGHKRKSGPTSPSPSVSSANSQPGTPILVIAGITGEGTAQSMTHGKDVEDAMGVKKKWLMA